MPTIEKSIDLDVPVNEAYAQWARFEEFPRFMEGVERVRRIDETRMEWTAEVAGQEASWEAQITELLPAQRIAWRSIDGKQTSGTVSFEELDGARSRVTVRMDWESDGIVETLGGMLGADDRRVEADLDRFRELVEGRSAVDEQHVAR